jgi:hypothetical protein
MLVSLIRKLMRDNRAATAVAMAILLVPMVISAGVAVDLARIASVRTLLQASVDGAAIAGVSEWQMSESSTNAYNISYNDFVNTGAQLSNFAPTVTPTVNLSCIATAIQCGGAQAFSTTPAYGCPTSGAYEYCVVVTAQLTLKNSLLAAFIPSELLSVTGGAISTLGTSPQPQPPRAGEGAHSAGDINLGGVGQVTMNGSTANFNSNEEANTYCSGSPSLLKLLPETTPANGVTTCNYLFISDSLNDTSSSSLSIAEDQYLDFVFLNETGANGYNQIDSTHYTTNLMISTTSAASGYAFSPNGESVVTPATTCTFNQPNCTPSKNGTVQLYGQCPDHTLYGSIDDAYGTPQSDSLNEYESANEVLGEPPTYTTNHVLTPFVTSNVVTQTINGKTYYVEAVCPNYSTAGTKINAPVSSTYSNANNGTFAGMNAFSTWFPTGVLSPPGIFSHYDTSTNPVYDQNNTAFTDNAASDVITNGVNDIYPPALAGCSPAFNATDNGVTPASGDPWWNWTSSNYGNCTAHQTSGYSNCTLLIQPLGTYVPVDSNDAALLPDYYNVIETPTGTILAMEPVYDNMTYSDAVTGVTITNTDPAGYVPSNSTPTSVVITNNTTIHGGGAATPFANTAFVGDLLVVQTPATSGAGQDHDMPQMTSGKCYNPGAAIQDGGYRPPGATSDLLGFYLYTNNGKSLLLPIDSVANPQLGAFLCNTNPPETYAVYWNDLGTYESDDLGYWNAVFAFTCSVPSTSNQGAGAPTLF